MMDPSEFFRAHIGAMLARGFVADAVHSELDLKGASEIWGGPGTDDYPAWYFWLNCSPGAYRLRLVDMETLDNGGAETLRGVFSIKYYPSCREPVFWHFSQQEQALINAGLFDETNTPKFEALDRVSEGLFGVGTIELTSDVTNDQWFLKYASLDRMRFRRLRAEYFNAEPGLVETADPAPPVRQLPAWDLGYPLFDVFVGLHVFLTRRAPKRIILSRQPGFEFIETEAGGLDSQTCAQASFKSLLLTCFPQHGDACSPIETMMTARQIAEPWIPQFDTAALQTGRPGSWDRDVYEPIGALAAVGEHDSCGCGCSHGRRPMGTALRHRIKVGEIDWEVPLAFNEHWWTLAETELRANTLPCGCR